MSDYAIKRAIYEVKRDLNTLLGDLPIRTNTQLVVILRAVLDMQAICHAVLELYSPRRAALMAWSIAPPHVPDEPEQGDGCDSADDER